MKKTPSRNTRQAINLAELIDEMPEEELIGEYDWMREPGDSVCSVPLDPDDTRDITAPLFLFFLGTPLLIALVRDIIFRNVFKAVLYGFGLTVVIVYGGWSFWGQYGACVS
ncbi:DUF2645 family protein [Pectobacterium carotovorum]|uniref:Inner membrane protein YgiZ n=1 Tax=Pectobacterium carotovorum TaxID=554 RepID=A0A0N9NN44_PECCA|nr:DUF2645 family protein [Pectobacterium carotovorum]ALG88637.1 Inner membrane protein YgiZ [Pectobacterium carotovorum]